MNEYKTKARTCLMEFFEEHPERRFTAKEVYDWLLKQVEGINKTTVYRNLERLSEQGILVKIKEANQDSWYYQYSKEHVHCNEHMHGRCLECGQVFHLEETFVADFEKSMKESYGFAVDPGQTVILGVCKDCKKKD